MPIASQFERQRAASEAGWFWGIARAYPERRRATVDVDGRESAFGELGRRVNRMSHALAALGLRPADCLTAVARITADYLALKLAVGQSGLYLVPAGTGRTATELTYVVRDSGSKLVLADRSTEVAAWEAAASAGLRFATPTTRARCARCCTRPCRARCTSRRR